MRRPTAESGRRTRTEDVDSVGEWSNDGQSRQEQTGNEKQCNEFMSKGGALCLRYACVRVHGFGHETNLRRLPNQLRLPNQKLVPTRCG